MFVQRHVVLKLNLASGSPRQRPRASCSVKFTLLDGSVLRAANIAQKLEKQNLEER